MTLYEFDWDPRKASSNIRKHKVSFHLATTVFRDPNHISVYDDLHSANEDRWVTQGIVTNGSLLVVIHTFEQIGAKHIKIRIISARRATTIEIAQYQEINQ